MPVWIITKSGNDFLVKLRAHFIQMDGVNSPPHVQIQYGVVNTKSQAESYLQKLVLKLRIIKRKENI